MAPGVFKAILYHAELKKTKSNGLLHRQMNTLSCRNENLSFFTSTVTMETNNISCIGTFLSQYIWTASSEFGTYRLCEQRRFRRACASAQSRQNLRCSLTQAVSQEEPSDRKPYPWPLWMAGHAQLKSVMTECSKTQIRLTGLILWR